MRWLRFVMPAVALAALTTSSASPAQEYYGYDGDVQPINLSGDQLDELAELVSSRLGDAGKDGADDGWEDTSGEKFTVKVGGRIQGDYVMFMGQNAGFDAENYWEFRRLRLFAEGEGYGVFDYKVQLDFENDEGGNDAPSMKDVYVGINEIPLLGRVVIGHHKAPFSLEELTSSKYITFLERSLPNVFAPGRRIGISAWNHTPSKCIGWGSGIFMDDQSENFREREADDQGVLMVSRVTANLYDEPSNGRYMTHFGVGVLRNEINDDQKAVGSIAFGSRPEIHEELSSSFVTTGPLLAQAWNTVGLEAAICRGPFSLQGEWMYTDVDDPADTALYGGYLYGSFFLTGESRGETYSREGGYFGRIKPYENFWIVPGCVGHGAWELTARVSYLDFEDAPTNEALTDWTFGVNWYWNPYMRYMFNYILPFGDNTDESHLDIVSMRLQIDF